MTITTSITAPPLPAEALLQRYRSKPGHATDCFACELPYSVTLADYVSAFYTTPLFRLERAILRLALRLPSTDAEAFAVARGSAIRFAAWDVEDRYGTQLLMHEKSGRTRSWFMVEALTDGTRLYFGSALVPISKTDADANPHRPPSRVFRLIHQLHFAYSRALLGAARRRVSTRQRSQSDR